jgi:hypothetical protein
MSMTLRASIGTHVAAVAGPLPSAYCRTLISQKPLSLAGYIGAICAKTGQATFAKVIVLSC